MTLSPSEDSCEKRSPEEEDLLARSNKKPKPNDGLLCSESIMDDFISEVGDEKEQDGEGKEQDNCPEGLLVITPSDSVSGAAVPSNPKVATDVQAVLKETMSNPASVGMEGVIFAKKIDAALTSAESKFGPWMIATKRNHRNHAPKSEGRNVLSNTDGSRFAALQNENHVQIVTESPPSHLYADSGPTKKPSTVVSEPPALSHARDKVASKEKEVIAFANALKSWISPSAGHQPKPPECVISASLNNGSGEVSTDLISAGAFQRMDEGAAASNV
ncbi:hypothetical protein RIF29_26909 [Crotalaria pallida]|uniref:Uncharacterized protein n=1 Tax=Crotalaria pallida TaxID=3830 RepID=A0AAN9I1X7_CROPI